MCVLCETLQEKRVPQMDRYARAKQVFVAVFLLVAPLCLGQTSKESITVNFVEVPVNVTDRAGNPIRGLKASNFGVIDDGKSRQITSFDAVDFSSKESAAEASPVSPAARHNFLLLF